MLDGSKDVLPWSDLDAVRAAVMLRDRITHRRHIPPRADTWAAIEVIEKGLKDFRIVDA